MNDDRPQPGRDASRVQEYFHRAARAFDAIYEPRRHPVRRLLDRGFRRSMRLRFARTLAGAAPYPGTTVLDVGCGAGRYGLALAQLGVRSVLGVDFAANMVAAANDRARALGLAAACRFVCADFAAMEIGQPYDHVIAMGVMDYVAQPLPFMVRMVGCARRSVMISFPARGGIVPLARRLLFRLVKRCPVYFYGAADVRRLAEQAGAGVFTVERLAQDYFLTIRPGAAVAAGE